MSLTSQETLGNWLIVALVERGGRATKADAVAQIEAMFGESLTNMDWHRHESNAEIRWQNRTAWQRSKFVRSGVLEPLDKSGWGVSKLTPKGYAIYADLPKTMKLKSTSG